MLEWPTVAYSCSWWVAVLTAKWSACADTARSGHITRWSYKPIFDAVRTYNYPEFTVQVSHDPWRSESGHRPLVQGSMAFCIESSAVCGGTLFFGVSVGPGFVALCLRVSRVLGSAGVRYWIATRAATRSDARLCEYAGDSRSWFMPSSLFLIDQLDGLSGGSSAVDHRRQPGTHHRSVPVGTPGGVYPMPARNRALRIDGVARGIIDN